MKRPEPQTHPTPRVRRHLRRPMVYAAVLATFFGCVTGTAGAANAADLATTAVSAPAGVGADPTAAAPPIQTSSGTTYYVDSATGTDSAAGTSAATAWKSLEKVDATTFAPGDLILLKAGSSWTSQLWPKGSGTAAASITVDSYGSGAKPVIAPAGQVADAVKLWNQQYWVVRDLDVSNTIPATGTPGANLEDLRGIHIGGDSGKTLNHLVVDAVTVHDVTGEVNWVSGSTSGNAPGVNFATGWDGSKRTGGIVFDTTVVDKAAPGTPTILNDVMVENSSVTNTSFAGITIKQYTGDTAGAVATGWGSRDNATDTKFQPHTNVVFTNNFITQAGTAYGCDGIYITNVRGASVDHNVIDKAGTSGIETNLADDINVNHNEVYDTQQKAGGADSNGIDTDKGTTKQVVEYNYLHGNGDGILICQFVFGDMIARFNVIASNTRYPIYYHSDKAATASVYNNTIYNDASNFLLYGYGTSLAATYVVKNNVIYSTRAQAALTTSPTITYDNNLYGGAALTVPAGDAHAIVADPLFAAPKITGAYGTYATGPQLQLADGYEVKSGSPAIDNGVAIANTVGVDYNGAMIPNGKPDLGAFEYSTAAGASTESLTGTVKDPAGHPVVDATVALSGVTATTTTDAAGRFSVLGVPFGTGTTLTVSRNGYTTTTTPVDIVSGNTSTVAVTLASNSVVGTVSGTVLDASAQPLVGATVAVQDAGQTLASATSAADGTFTIANTPVGTNYSVVVSANGFLAATRTATVTPSSTVALGQIALAPAHPTYLYVHDFDALPTGALATGTDGLTVTPTGGSIAVTPATTGTNKYATLTRGTNSGNTSLSQVFSTPLKGIITVESDVMRDDGNAPAANFFALPYVRGTNGANSISVAFSKGTITAYNGASSTSVGSYMQGTWYHVAEVIDTARQTYTLTINGKAVLTDVGFRVPLDAIATIDYYASSSNYGSLHVDNIRIARGIAYAPSDASLGTLVTSAGSPTEQDATNYALTLPAGTNSLDVTATAASTFAKQVVVNGTTATAVAPTVTVPLTADDQSVPVVVTSENGTVVTYTLSLHRDSLAADNSLTALGISAGSLTPAFDPNVYDYTLALTSDVTSITFTPTSLNPGSVITVGAGTTPVASGSASPQVTVPVGTTAIPVTVVSQDGTANATYTVTLMRDAPAAPPTPTLPQDGATSVPGQAVLSSTSGWANGLADGNFDLVINMWWGTDASVVVFYENGTEIGRQSLTSATPSAQSASLHISGKPNGSYVYSAALQNQAGTAKTADLTVAVTAANPGSPSVSNDNWDGDGSFTVSTDLWWGTNATEYTLFEDGQLVDTHSLTAATPSAQHASTLISGASIGDHVFTVELSNAAGATRSADMHVTVNK